MNPAKMSAEAPAPATLVYSPTPTPTEPAMAVMSAPQAVTGYNRTITYAYDSLYRLTGAVYTEGATVNEYVYGYDLRGNRTSVTAPGVGTFTYSYNLANQIGGFSYDLNGNLISDGPLTYTYDAANRLRKVIRGAETLEYAYTGNGDRYAHTLTHSTEITSVNYLLDPSGALSRVLSETIDTPTADWTNTYLYGLGILGQQNGSTWSTFGTDPLGSVRFLLDNTGEIASRADYDPYGVPLPVPGQESGMDTTLGFTGEQTDPFGLVNLRARTYNPRWGAFTSVDPVEGILSRSASRNGYSYVEGNPANLTDPSGECPFCFGVLFALIGGLAASTALTYADVIHQVDVKTRFEGRALDTAWSEIDWRSVQKSAQTGTMLGLTAGLWSGAGVFEGVFGGTLRAGFEAFKVNIFAAIAGESAKSSAVAFWGSTLSGLAYTATITLPNYTSGYPLFQGFSLYDLSSNMLFGSLSSTASYVVSLLPAANAIHNVSRYIAVGSITSIAQSTLTGMDLNSHVAGIHAFALGFGNLTSLLATSLGYALASVGWSTYLSMSIPRLKMDELVTQISRLGIDLKSRRPIQGAFSYQSRFGIDPWDMRAILRDTRSNNKRSSKAFLEEVSAPLLRGGSK